MVTKKTQRSRVEDSPVYKAMTSQKGRMYINGLDELHAERLERQLVKSGEILREYGYQITPELPNASPPTAKVNLGVGWANNSSGNDRRMQWKRYAKLGYRTIQLGVNTQDMDRLVETKAREIKELQKELGLRVTVGFLIGNISHPNIPFRNALNKIARQAVDVLEELEAPVFTGHGGYELPDSDPEEMWDLQVPIVSELNDYCADHNVKFAIEAVRHKSAISCVYNVPTYKRLFKEIPSKNLGIALDCSHFVWMMIDNIRFIRTFPGRIWQIQAKDAEILPDVLADYGIHHGERMIWWRYRAPGFGVLNWAQILATARDNGFNLDAVHVEAEDPVFPQQESLARCARYLLPIMNSTFPNEE